ncbi:MAG: hypothetical protein C0467_17535 [Planctomycetaceae bacterium]|nr:hypothetical protein [Planctomycetaceae bacterium]
MIGGLGVDIEERLRDALATATNGGRTGYAVAKAAGLKPELLYRFARGGDLRLRSAAKLAAVLGLTLVPATTDAGQAKPEQEQPARPKRKRK